MENGRIIIGSFKTSSTKSYCFVAYLKKHLWKLGSWRQVDSISFQTLSVFLKRRIEELLEYFPDNCEGDFSATTEET